MSPARSLALASTLFALGCTCGAPSAPPASPPARSAPQPQPEPAEPTTPEATSAPRVDRARAGDARDAIREGRREARAGHHAEALAAFDRALEIVPGAPRLRCESGYVAFRGGDLARAERDLDAALLLLPDPERAPADLRVPLAMCLYNRGLVHEARGEAREARRRFAESLSLRPNAVVQRHLDALPESSENRAATGETLDAILARFEECYDPCDSGDEDGSEECSMQTPATIDGADAPAADDHRVVELTFPECLSEMEEMLIAIRGTGGWRLFQAASGESSTTDNFYRAEASFEAALTALDRISPTLLRATFVTDDSSRYGDTLEPPDDTEDDPGCMVDHNEETVSAMTVLCRVGVDPTCVAIETARRESSSSDVFCEGADELPAWAQAVQSESESDPDEELEDAVQVVVAGDDVEVRIVHPAEWIRITPGRRSIDALFRELPALEERALPEREDDDEE